MTQSSGKEALFHKEIRPSHYKLASVNVGSIVGDEVVAHRIIDQLFSTDTGGVSTGQAYEASRLGQELRHSLHSSSIDSNNSDKDKSATVHTGKRRRQCSDKSLLYGETYFVPFARVLRTVREKYGGLQNSGETFIDIGSGTGKATIAAALLHPFGWKRCIGVEILRPLHEIAGTVLEKYDRIIRPKLHECQKATEIKFLCGDATEFSDEMIYMKEASLAFCCSTVFSGELMRGVAQLAGRMPVGSFFISLTKDLPCSTWEVLERRRMDRDNMMSFGVYTMIIQRKVKTGFVYSVKDKQFCAKEDPYFAYVLEFEDGDSITATKQLPPWLKSIEANRMI